MRLLLAIAIVAMAAGLMGCKTPEAGGQNRANRALPENDGAARAAGLADKEISAARQLYVAKCARCHKFYDPADYDNGEWDSWMTKMNQKARLKPDQGQLLARYLEVFRSPTP
jgi:cytochrome c5